MSTEVSTAPHRVVIVGGGFGGLRAAQALKRAPVQTTLIDRRNFHLFQPLLYQVATGGLSPGDIAAPLREILKRQPNTLVLLAEVIGFDVAARQVLLRSGEHVPYDTLIVAAGASHHYFGRDDWEPMAPGLKTVEDATEIRRCILLAFETAEWIAAPEQVREWLTFVIVGGGPTGVEMAGALSEVARDTLRANFRHINPAQARIIVLEAGESILPTFPPELATRARESLERLGVTVRTRTRVVDIRPTEVLIEAHGVREAIPARTAIWAAGTRANPLGKLLAGAAGTQPDRAGRVLVGPDCAVPGHPEVFVIGDLAACPDPRTQKPLPGVAPVAMQQGRYVANLICARLRGNTLPAFRYHDRGMMAVIGRAAAVADLPWAQFSGYLAWLAWLFVHLVSLIGFANRMLVLIQWAWNYFTRNRTARLITGPRQTAPGAETERRG